MGICVHAHLHECQVWRVARLAVVDKDELGGAAMLQAQHGDDLSGGL